MSAVIPRAVATTWHETLVALSLLLAGALLVYRETAAAMVEIWLRSATFTHAILVPPIVAWLVWRQRGALAAEVPRPMPWTLLGVALVGTFWLIGELAVANAAAQFALVAMLVLLTVTMLGRRAARTIAFPLGFLFFAVPIGEFMMPQLMVWTADFTAFALRASGIPVYREGQRLVIPTGAWSVVEACSGIRYLIASVMVGTLFAYLSYSTLKRRLLFVAVSVAVPVVANWLRAYLIVMTGHLSSNQLAVGVDHLIYGWLFFGIVITMMFLIGARWAEPRGGAAIKVHRPFGDVKAAERSRIWATAVGLVVLIIGPHVVLAGVERGVAQHAAVLAPAALDHAGWRPGPRATDWKPAFQGASAETNQLYVDGQGRVVGLYIGYYRQQNAERKLVSSENVLVNVSDPTWAVVGTGRHQVVAGGRPIDFRTARLKVKMRFNADERELLAWQVYWINGTLVENELHARLLGALYQLAGRGDDAAVVVVYTPHIREAEDVLEGFMKENWPVLDAQLVTTRDGEAVAGKLRSGS
jgi:exosortase A